MIGLNEGGRDEAKETTGLFLGEVEVVSLFKGCVVVRLGDFEGILRNWVLDSNACIISPSVVDG